ncbi:MAG: 1-acyl-sn-glycerol-3-phosphate acyltransferase [Proteobacteria bacterium]|nr:1-acyl-sn-glycerol-3-phosphate acyltransferase [Pseudomonadota bacterium]
MPKGIIWLGSLVRLLHITVFCGFAFVLFAGGGAVLAYLFFPLASLFSRKTIRQRAIRQRMVQLSFRAYYFYLNIFGLIKGELNTKEMENFKSNRVVFVANHPTLLDFVLLASALPKVVCIVKLAVWNNPFLSRLAKGMGYIPFTDGQGVLDLGIKRIQEDFPILIFPEGTRSPEGGLGEFNKGAAYIALASGASIVPISMSISAPILMKGWKWWQVVPHRVTMTAEFHPAISTKELLVECDGNLPKASRKLTRNLVDFFSQRIHT